MLAEDHALEELADFVAEIAYDGSSQQAMGLDLPIAVINLPHRTDRWQAVSSRMAAVGLTKLIRVAAVDGAKLKLERLKGLLGQPTALIEQAPRSHETMTRPAIGCFLSHLGIWQWMARQRLPHVLVLEDDAKPAPDFSPERFAEVMSNQARGADLLLLGRIIMNGMADRATGGSLPRIFYFNGTFAYLITPAACRALLPRLLPLNGHIDHQISRALIDLRNQFSAFYTEPAFFEPDWSLRSDCYVPLDGESEADRELGRLLGDKRQLLLDDGRPLLAPFA